VSILRYLTAILSDLLHNSIGKYHSSNLNALERLIWVLSGKDGLVCSINHVSR